MRCSRCGNDYPSTSARCTRCGHVVIKEKSSVSDSRLIEFPLRTRMSENNQQANQQLPAWRVELSEKVRAIKAQKELNGANGSHPAGLSGNQGKAATATAKSEPANDYSSPNPKIQAALLRAKRANENALRAAIPRIEPAPTMQQNVLLAGDKTATAKVLQPPVRELVEPDLEPQHTETRPDRPTRREGDAFLFGQSDSALDPINVPDVPRQNTEALRFKPLIEEEHRPDRVRKPENETVKYLDENCTLDYLDAEVQKVEREAAKSSPPHQPASISTQALITGIDLLVIAVSCVPFLLLMKYNSGSLSNAPWATVYVAILVSSFYLILTQALCKKTFGMMVTKTHLVDGLSFSPPPVFAIIFRTAGFFLSLIPALLGFFWVAVDSQQRSWQDIISGTLIVRDR